MTADASHRARGLQRRSPPLTRCGGVPDRRTDIEHYPPPTTGAYTNEVTQMNENGTTAAGREPRWGDWVVSQAMLREFKVLAARAKRLRALRARLVALLEAGAPIQPGPLTATVTRREVRRLTKGKLIALIGAKRVETFMERIALSESTSLSVCEV